jgi:Skp family chaperone for outer membrane proteins
MRIILVITFLFAALSSCTQKTAFVSEAKVLAATPGYALAIQEMDSVKTVYTQTLTLDQEQLNQKIDKLLAPYHLKRDMPLADIEAALSEADKKRFALLQEEAQLQDKQLKIFEQDYQALYQVKVGLIVQKANEQIQSYCKANKIEILYKREVINQSLVYVDDKLDITQDIIQLINSNK